MKKLIKIILGIVAAIVLLLVLAVALFAIFFDANSFRGQIAAQVKTATGRDITIGDIKLSIFPTLGARIQKVTLSNAPGFGDAYFAGVGQAEVGVKLLPLLREHAVQVSSVTVDNLQLNLAKHADGKTNWDDLVEKTSGPAKTPTQQTSSGNSIKSIDIAGISIDNAAISYKDDQAHQSYELSKLKLDTGAIEPGKAFSFDLSFSTKLTQPAITADTEISTKLSFDLAAKTYQASKLKLKVKASGKEIPNGSQTAELDADISYDGTKGSLSLANGKLEAGGLSATASLQGSGLNGSAGRFAGPLSIKPFNPRELMKTFGMAPIETADADALKNISVSAQIEGSASAARLSNLVLELDQTHLSGSLGVSSFATQALDFALKADALDADRYLPPPKQQPAATPAARKDAGGPAAPSTSSDATVLPVDALEKLNANGTLDVGKFKLQNLSMTDVHLKIAAPKGHEKRIDLGAKLYSGTIDNTTRITPGAKPVLAESVKLASISVGPLLKDLNGKDSLTGTGNVSVDVNGAGRTVGELKRALDGNVSFNFKDGKVKGFNLGAILRKGEAFMNGQQLDENAPPETDFTELSASGKIVNGVLNSDDLNASSPLFRVGGAGKVDIAGQTIDYVAKPTIVNTASGQGGKQLADLNGVVIPVHVTGTFAQPHYSLDVKSALQQKATEKIQNKIGDQLDKKLGAKNPELTNQLKQGLGALFGRKSKPADTPAPAQPAAPNP